MWHILIKRKKKKKMWRMIRKVRINFTQLKREK